MAKTLNRHTLVVMAVKLVQPGKLSDVVEGLQRIVASTPEYKSLKEGVRSELEQLVISGLVEIYAGQRYMLTSRGEAFSGQTGIEYLIEARRMYLLKETRRTMKSTRSDARNRSLLQRPEF
jgi:hypothetical protein